METLKDMNRKSNPAKLKTPHFLISKYTTELQKLQQYCACIRQRSNQWNRLKSPEINICIYGQPDLYWKCQEYTIGKGQFPQQMVLRKLDIHMQKNETLPLFYTIYTNQLKMD